MAIALHAVHRGEVSKNNVAIVIGCGPVGLAVICMLKANGVKTVVASDLSAGRRTLAQACGADIVVDPAEQSPYERRRPRHIRPARRVDLALDTREKLEKLPVTWHVWRLGETLGAGPKRPVIFECVGVPGMIDGVIAAAPLGSRVVVAGVCMEPDRIRPAMAINKEIDLRFVVGYGPVEFRDTLHLLADGKVDATPLVTGTVGLDGVVRVPTLGDPEQHAKILIDPQRVELRARVVDAARAQRPPVAEPHPDAQAHRALGRAAQVDGHAQGAAGARCAHALAPEDRLHRADVGAAGQRDVCGAKPGPRRTPVVGEGALPGHTSSVTRST